MKRLILLADDSPTIQRLVTQTFAGGEFDIVCVSNGDAALRKFEEVRPDLVLADIYMPGKNGYEVCAAVKKHSELGDTPVVLLAGAFDAFDDETANQVGAAAHITKPFEPQALLSLVSSLAPKSAARSRPAAASAAAVVATVAPRTVTPPVVPAAPIAPVDEPAEDVLAVTTMVSTELEEPISALDPAPPANIPETAPEPEPTPAFAPSPVVTPVATAPSWAQPAAKPAAPAAATEGAADGGDLLGLQDLFKPASAPLSLASLTDAEVERIAERVIQKLSTQVIENVAWDVVPDITTKVLKEELKRRS